MYSQILAHIPTRPAVVADRCNVASNGHRYGVVLPNLVAIRLPSVVSGVRTTVRDHYAAELTPSGSSVVRKGVQSVQVRPNQP